MLVRTGIHPSFAIVDAQRTDATLLGYRVDAGNGFGPIVNEHPSDALASSRCVLRFR